MDIFVLEDDPGRIAWFKKKFDGHTVECTCRVFKAAESLKNKKYDLIFLDRDVSHTRWSGEDLAFKMWREKIAVDTPVFIHSMNENGQKIIKAYLDHEHKTVIQIPFKDMKHLSVDEMLIYAGLKD